MSDERKKQAERLQEAVDHLKQIGVIKFQKDLANFVNYNYQVINKMVKQAPTDEFLYDFAKTFKDIFNEEYLKEGSGILLKEKSEDDNPGDIRYIEGLKERLRIAESRILYLEQQLVIANKHYDDARKDIEGYKKTIDSYIKILNNNNKKEVANAG